MTTGNEYLVSFISADNQTEIAKLQSNTNATLAEIHGEPTIVRLNSTAWKQAYGGQYVAKYQDVVLVVDRMALKMEKYSSLVTANDSWSIEWPEPILVDPTKDTSLFAALPFATLQRVWRDSPSVPHSVSPLGLSDATTCTSHTPWQRGLAM